MKTRCLPSRLLKGVWLMSLLATRLYLSLVYNECVQGTSITHGFCNSYCRTVEASVAALYRRAVPMGTCLAGRSWCHLPRAIVPQILLRGTRKSGNHCRRPPPTACATKETINRDINTYRARKTAGSHLNNNKPLRVSLMLVKPIVALTSSFHACLKRCEPHTSS